MNLKEFTTARHIEKPRDIWNKQPFRRCSTKILFLWFSNMSRHHSKHVQISLLTRCWIVDIPVSCRGAKQLAWYWHTLWPDRKKERCVYIYICIYIYMHIYTSTACIVIYTYIRSSMYRKGTWSNHCGLLKTLCVGVSVAYVGGLDHFLGFPHILGTSSPQLTNSYFPAGVGFNHQPDKHLWQILACWGHFAAHCASDSRRIHKPTPARASQSQSWRCRDDAKTV